MNTLKTGLFTLGLLIGTASFAQTTQKDVKMRPQDQTERLATELNLTPEQKEKVSNLNNGVALKNEAILNNASLTQDQKKASLQGNNNAKREQMKVILTEEQYTKYLSMETKEQHREYINHDQPKGQKEIKTEEK